MTSGTTTTPPTSSAKDGTLVTGAAGLTTDDQTNAAERRAAGEFVRGVSTARNWVVASDTTTNNSNNRGGNNESSNSLLYPVASERYHLYVAYNCPWCHRVLLGRAIQGLEDVISVDVLFPNRSSDDERLGPNLWKFEPEGQTGLNGQHVKFPSCTKDSVLGKKYVKEIYEASGIHDQKSVPILFDKETKTVVNNESAEILRMFGTTFRNISKNSSTIDLYPTEHRKAIDEMNDWVYQKVANGSYKAGFSSNQDVYEGAYQSFFAAMDELNSIFQQRKFLICEQVTEADLRLFPPIFRFDPVYYSRFKLNYKQLWEYRNIWRWMQDMMALPGMESVADAEYLQHCKQGYFGRTGNGTVPVGPPGYPECYKTKHWSHP